jgi:hypothetical protein
MGVLKVRVNGVWEEIGVPEPPMDEVWVGAGPPDPVGSYEVWVDNTVDPAVLHFKDQIGLWHELDTGNEVTVGHVDPYTSNPLSVDELWVDTSAGAPGILKARVGGQWQPLIRYGGVSYEQQYGQEPFAGTLDIAARADHTHGTPGEEVVRGDSAPTEDHTDLWWDTSADPPILKVRESNGSSTWVPVDSAAEPPLDEVWVGTTTPDPAGTYEAWYNTSTVPGKLYLRREDGSWEEVGSSEVEVRPDDPYLSPDGSSAELWHNTAAGQDGRLYVRIPRGPAGQWRPVVETAQSEVEISANDPKMTIGSNPAVNDAAELWVDTSSTPPTLWGWVNGGWAQLTGPDPMVPQEVHIGPADPMDVTTELWYDTTLSPKGTLYANNNGVWEAIGGSAEVFVGTSDPRVDDPTSEILLWHDTRAGSPGILKAWLQDHWQEVFIVGGAGVAYETSYGQEPREGNLNVAAAADHSHGTPPPEVVVGDNDPYLLATPIPADLWYDTSV